MLSSNNASCTFRCPVWSVVPGDFNGDALMDALVSLRCEANKPIYDQIIIWGYLSNFNCTNGTLLKTYGQVLALDYNDDFITDLYGEDKEGRRSFWIFSKDKQIEKIRDEGKCGKEGLALKGFRVPHSNAFLDFNNDCIEDLFVVSGDDDNQLFEVS